MGSASVNQKIHTIDDLKLLVAPVAEKYGVAKVYLFGSMARGDHDDDSDYDFCIDAGEIRGSKLGGFFIDLKEAVGREIGLITTGTSNQKLLDAVMREGVILYNGRQ
jgi:predicted nucleotidyltransferase